MNHIRCRLWEGDEFTVGTSIIEHQFAEAVMDGHVLALGAPRAGHSAGVQPIDKPRVGSLDKERRTG